MSTRELDVLASHLQPLGFALLSVESKPMGGYVITGHRETTVRLDSLDVHRAVEAGESLIDVITQRVKEHLEGERASA